MGAIQLSDYCNKVWSSVVEILESDVYSGLNKEECNKRRKKFGSNKIKLPFDKGVLSFIKSFLGIYQILSIIITGYFIYEEDFEYAIVATIMLLINISVELVYTIKKYKKTIYLNKINSLSCTVLRNSSKETIPTSELVIGDIVYFKTNSVIPADIRIIEGEKLKVDEKNITGESFLKDKITSKIDYTIDSINEMRNMLFRGSVIKSGHGYGIVVQVGEKTELGKMMKVINEANNKYNFTKSLKRNINSFVILILFLVGVFSILSYNLYESFDNIKIAVLVLESLPLGLIIFSYSNILRNKLNKKGIELYNISVLDSIEDIQYIFLDKVYALTKNEMIVNNFLTNSNVYKYEEIIPKNNPNIERMLEIIVLCNDAKYNLLEGTGDGNLIDIAYLKMAAEKEVFKKAVEAKNPRLFQVPMDSDKRVLSSVNTYKKGYRANVTGNVDAVVARCTHILINGVEQAITNEEAQRVRDLDYNYSIEGLITQGVAYRNFSYKPSLDENIESNLVFVGILTLVNPENDNMENQITKVKNKGIIPVLFTEDNKLSAVAIGKKANIISDIGGAISGVELTLLSDEEFTKSRTKAKVFARVNPTIKNKIVSEYISDGYEVATSGEALGDLSRMAISKIGIAKGKPANIIKNTADLYIKDNYLSGFLSLFNVAKTFKMGIYKQKLFLMFLLLSEILIIFGSPFMNYNISFFTLFIINIVLVIPMSLVVLNSGENEELSNRFFIRCIVWTCFIFFNISNSKDSVDIIIMLLYTGMILIYTFFAKGSSLGKLNFIKPTLDLILFECALGLSIISIIIFMLVNNINIEISTLIKCGITLIIYLIFELIIKNWE